MDQIIRLTTQNPLSKLVSSYIMKCPNENCSGHGECHNGTCFCEIQYDGDECHAPNVPYYVAFASIFFLLALVSMIQLIMCVVAEYHKMKSPSILRACRVTTQKLLYFLVFLAATIRGAYFTSPTGVREGWSSSLMSAYYPLLLSGSSLVVCLWAEVFHLRDMRWERNQFLSKSFLGFVTFNILTYSLLIAEFITTKVSMTAEKRLLQQHIFNGCYAVLLFIVVVFFLIYGVEVFFKVRGGFIGETVTSISHRTPVEERHASSPLTVKLCNTVASTNCITGVDVSQLHQSRLGLVSQAFMLIIVVGFLFSETLGEFWKTKAPIYTRNWHDITFRIVEIGVVLWFPCVLWNCMSPDQLWILNPRKLLKKLEPPPEQVVLEKKAENFSEEVSEPFKDCWICYDPERTDAGPLIQPCKCSGDVSSVHHDCLRRWLVESSSTTSSKEALVCKVCKCPYEVERTQKLNWQNGFNTQHWLKTSVFVTVMCVAGAGAWATIQLFTDQYIRMMAASFAVLVWYICARFLGVNTAIAYQRAKVSGLNIVGSVATVSETVETKDTEPVPVHGQTVKTT
ncbi:UNVERIFIED_CONTAM: hypothetical protein PYX00_004198 [Menopon gallinae]|uniref:RING-CH-type domain-containing protein n=1 Tax=Menopon gallinae TaxID=328185 RepID=A0AAW2I4N9_9NEOP